MCGMPPKHRLERIGKKEESIKSDEYPLVQAVLGGRTNDENIEVHAEFECERKYLPARALSMEELERLSGGHKREIEQCYVKTDQGTVRLRKTIHEGEEGELYRVAHKAKIPDSAGKMEYQAKFPPDSTHAQEFNALWEKHSWNIVEKTRYYIPWTLPNGNVCEIHYDIHHAKEGNPLNGFVRIEVELKSDEDAVYVEGYHGHQSVLPDWIGKDVTADEMYSGKEMAKKGIQKGL